MSDSRDTRLRFEQWAKNPMCTANAISAVHNVPMTDVARKEGAKPSFGQSPFALARGNSFERSLFKDDAASMHAALVRADVLPEARSGFRDFRIRMNGGPEHDHDSALAATLTFLRQVADAKDAKALARIPAILAGPVVRIPGGIMLPEAILVIDCLVVRVVDDRPQLMVGEIKTYPDRGGYTDTGELATARAQAGVYVHGLRVVLDELGLTDRLAVSDEGFLVLTRPGFNQPSVRAGESLRFQAERAKRGFERLRALAQEIGGSTKPAVVIPRILESETHYCEACLSFCDRAPICHEAARRNRTASILGDEMVHFLGAVPLERALALIDGAKPGNAAEQELATRMDDLRVEGER